MSNMQEEKEKIEDYLDLIRIEEMEKADIVHGNLDQEFAYAWGFDAGVKAERERLGKILSEQYFTESMWKELIPDEQEGDR